MFGKRSAKSLTLTSSNGNGNRAHALCSNGDACRFYGQHRTGIVREKHWRSVVKAISWRVTGTIDTMVISWIVTQRLEFALSIGFFEAFTKILWYYLHERVWDRIQAGREAPEYQI